MQKTINVKAIALVLIFAMFASAVVAFSPTVDAAQYWYYSHVYVGTSAGARGVGVGQTILLVAWTAEMPPDQGEAAGLISSPTGRAGWSGMKINVTSPSNVSEIIDMPYSDPVGANYISYVPEEVGTYQVQAIFPYTVKNITTTNNIGGMSVRAGDSRIYTADTSPVATFVVTAEAQPDWTESPIPNDYWTRPVSSAARRWYALTSDWLGSAANVWPIGSSGGNVGSYGYGQAPESAHILWSKPFFIGGVMDERLGDINYQTSHYQGTTFSPAIILDGKIHWSPRLTSNGNQGWEIIDLYTGETLYKNWTDTVPNMGSIYLYESPNQHGGFPYLWRTNAAGLVPQNIMVASAVQTANLSVIKTGNSYTINRTQTTTPLGTVWQMVDGYTMQPICYIANVSSSGTQVYGKDGSILYYNMVNKTLSQSNPIWYLTIWNSSAGTMVADQLGTGYWQWRPAGGHFGADNPYFSSGSFMSASPMLYNNVHNGALFYSQNFSIGSILGPVNSRQNETASIKSIRQDEFVIIGTNGVNDERGAAPTWLKCISLAPSTKGQTLWETKFTPPFCPAAQNITVAAMFTGGFRMDGVYPEDGIVTFSEVKQCKRWAFDMKTGEQLWEAVDPNQFTYYGMSQIVYEHQVIGYGSYSGELRSYDARTGDLNWVYSANNTGMESPYGNYPMIVGAVADGKIYTYTSEHSFTHPLYRGPNLRCINASNGVELWSILSFGGGYGIADGRLVTSNSMDNQIYCYGRGPSQTTVSTPQVVPPVGSTIQLQGTVTDQTPTGRRTTNDRVDWTLKGTPAISDKDMAAWMEYKFMEQAYPADATGVPVTLSAIDPNGNYVDIGTVTSDVTGNYAVAFEPEVPGTYQITASFAGSAAYGPSSSMAYLTIGEAAATTPAPTTVSNDSVADQYFVPAVIGIIIAIIAVGAINMLVARKRP